MREHLIEQAGAQRSYTHATALRGVS